jgi:predicted metal-binding membrane protein
VLLGLIGITLLAWTYTIHLAWNMGNMNMAMPRTQDWGVLELFLLFLMWAFMMAAMMVPSASPMVLMFTTTLQRRGHRQSALVQPGLFVLGLSSYLDRVQPASHARSVGTTCRCFTFPAGGKHQSCARRRLAHDSGGLSMVAP